MSDNAVSLLTELWILPGSFQKLKQYRRKLNAILDKYHPEIVFHNHAFEWLAGEAEGDFPSGTEIVKFDNEHLARTAVAEYAASELKPLEKEIFSRIRCYFAVMLLLLIYA